MANDHEILVRPARPDDNAALLDLLRRTPQMGSVTLTFEREPDFFSGALVACEAPQVLVAEHGERPGHLLGMVDIGQRQQYINGQPCRVGYLHDLRIAAEGRGGRVLGALFRAIATAMQTPGSWMEAVILEDNLIPLGIVGRGRAGLPNFYPNGRITTSLLPGRQSRRHADSGLQIRAASAADAQAMQQLWQQAASRQGFPVYEIEALLAGSPYYLGLRIEDYWLACLDGQVVGVVGVWKQKAFKQTRVARYSPWLAALRTPYNLYSRLFGGLHLPAVGDTFDYLHLHGLSVRNDDPLVFQALLEHVLAHQVQPRQSLVCGFFDDDPLAQVVSRYRRQTLHSRHFLLSYDHDPRPAQAHGHRHVEIARL
ncbi:hypothetical protein OU800_20510 [Pseudomonas sp. GOM7]|uniref:GNAT family N-acetyltransferase n=1 Tax=Pseudomonas sp. GOM7 TaxID=2998079 RepID=UPI00227BA36F|nr:hypothetical protein [Pseudomonas sp. GOM7]WAJ36961.1 hypothetical protein OU800_20510 [Pseudomonas sp. GOM7]